MKKIAYILAVCGAIALIVGVLVSNKRAAAERTRKLAEFSSTVAVRAEVVASCEYSGGFTSVGVLEALRDLSFLSDVTGRVVRIYVDEGQSVKKGQLLMQIDSEMLSAEAASNEATYNALKKDYERFKNANAQGGVTDQQLDNIRTQMIAAESRYLTSRRRLADASVKAPIGGSIEKRYVEVGSFVNPGSKLFDIVDVSELKASCFVTEKQRLNLLRGQSVLLRADAFPGESFEGRLSFVGEKADRSLNFPVEIAIKGDKKGLKPGMFVTAVFEPEEQKQGILVPRSAVGGSVQAAHVFVLSKGKAKKRKVVTGNMVDERIELLEGLQPGDSIVVAGLINLTDGAPVRVVE